MKVYVVYAEDFSNIGHPYSDVVSVFTSREAAEKDLIKCGFIEHYDRSWEYEDTSISEFRYILERELED